MSRHWQGILAAAVVVAALPAAPQAQGQGRMQAMGYDLATEVTLGGRVTGITLHEGMGMGSGVHLTFEAAAGTFQVHLGPKRWLDEQGYTIAEGDELVVTGSRTTRPDPETGRDQEALIARRIERGTETMTLRDENGRPLWAGAGRR